MQDKTRTASISGRRRLITATTVTALFGALTAAGTFISIPLPLNPVPIVLQNMFAILSGLVLGPILGGAAVALYLVAGALGAPVFSGGAGGFVHFFSPTGGYLFGYLFAAIVAGLLAGRPRRDRRTPVWRITLATVCGFLAVYVPGLLGLKAALNSSWLAVVSTGFLPFLIGDTVKAIGAALISLRLRRLTADLLD